MSSVQGLQTILGIGFKAAETDTWIRQRLLAGVEKGKEDRLLLIERNRLGGGVFAVVLR